jgi:hypothetical protein
MPQPDRRDPSEATLALTQAGVALALLIALPLVLEAPTTPLGVFGIIVAALALFAFLVEGATRFLRSRRRPFLDSMLPTEADRAAAKKDKAGD